MQLEEAITKRMSVRAFIDRPVEQALIGEILSLAVRSPSWGNTQPWELAVAGRETTKTLTAEFQRLIQAGQPANPDFPMPGKFVAPYNDRYKAVGKDVFQLKGIGRDDHQARMDHIIQNFGAFGAPNLVYILLDSRLETIYPVFDAGAMTAHLCLLATARGLGTCILSVLAYYPDVVRQVLGLGPEKRVVIGLALGYPNQAAPINTLHTPREPLEGTVTWK